MSNTETTAMMHIDQKKGMNSPRMETGVGEGPVPSRGPGTRGPLNALAVQKPGLGSGDRRRAGCPLGLPPLRRGRRPLLAVAALLMMLCASAFRPEQASAHPLGNFTINQYGRIEATTDGLRLVYVLDMAEIPAFQEIQSIDADADGNGDISPAERETYLAAKLPEIAKQLHLAVDGQEVPLTTTDQEITFPEGQAGLKLLRLRAVFVPSAPFDATASSHNVTYRNDFDADRLGWKEIVVTHGAGIVLDGPDVAMTDTSDELRAYPEDLLKTPLDQTAATFGLILRHGAPAAPDFARFASAEPATSRGAKTGRPDGGTTGARFASLLGGDDLTKTGIAAALLLAAVWGALHALSPGHGKTVVGVYLVGSRGTPRHAVFLGLTVTITHTAGVLALGM
ncbi:MAG: nickel/cobalt transporter (NicO) family protein, partial [Thermomicrobiales bacterium]|nr:nickel/cobalt transporter (NicO) family protein [Thermomicrobiales bacterium]